MSLEPLVKRVFYSKMGTYSHLTVGDYKCLILEDPWNDNKEGVSCIPPGHYPLKLGIYFGGDGPGGKEDYPSYEILEVPGRKLIKMHIGNTIKDTQGCLLFGTDIAVYNDLWSIAASRKAYAGFMDVMAGIDSTFITIDATNAGMI